jgi:hypothetical protein
MMYARLEADDECKRLWRVTYCLVQAKKHGNLAVEMRDYLVNE